MSITYTVPEIQDSDNSIEVTYANADSHVHKRQLNIPRDSEGALVAEEWQAILDSQLLNVTNKSTLGVISFADPNATPEGETPEEEESTAEE